MKLISGPTDPFRAHYTVVQAVLQHMLCTITCFIYFYFAQQLQKAHTTSWGALMSE